MSLLDDQLLSDIRAHATREYPRECCGLIVTYRRRKSYVPCRNIAMQNEHFVMHPEDYAAAEDKGTLLAIVHSHPNISPQPSQADLVGIERTQLPWVIVNLPVGHYTVTEPSGYVAPLVGREFSHGVLDCYTIIRDYYKQELGIEIPDFVREDEWWKKDQNLYRDNFAKAGFREVPFDSMQTHDVLLMQVASTVENHGAVYIGRNLILQHVMNCISSRDVYGGYWRMITKTVLRHEAFPS